MYFRCPGQSLSELQQEEHPPGRTIRTLFLPPFSTSRFVVQVKAYFDWNSKDNSTSLGDLFCSEFVANAYLAVGLLSQDVSVFCAHAHPHARTHVSTRIHSTLREGGRERGRKFGEGWRGRDLEAECVCGKYATVMTAKVICLTSLGKR